MPKRLIGFEIVPDSVGDGIVVAWRPEDPDRHLRSPRAGDFFQFSGCEIGTGDGARQPGEPHARQSRAAQAFRERRPIDGPQAIFKRRAGDNLVGYSRKKSR